MKLKKMIVFSKKSFHFKNICYTENKKSIGFLPVQVILGRGEEAMCMKSMLKRMLPLLLAAAMLSGCGQTIQDGSASTGMTEEAVSSAFTDEAVLEDAEIQDEAVALSATAASTAPTVLEPVASGTAVKTNTKAVIDYSNIADGYVMVKYTASTAKKLKAQVKGPSGTTYTYNLTAGQWATFPLSDENGSYKVTVYENVSDMKYATVLSVSFTAAMTDPFAPFLRPNQYVNYSADSKTVAKAAELTKGESDPLEKVKAVYEFVVKNLTYDKQKAATVRSGYLPVLDTVLAQKKGICFDYAALMTAMLRSQDVPCKLVVGYAGTAYHAWISVYSGETGWITGAIYFDGTSWKLMDPTFASSGKQSDSVMKYIGDGSHYTAKYIY